MSIVALKRKSQAKQGVSSTPGGFSLNSPHRAETQARYPSIQTRMRGLAYHGHGGRKFVVNPVATQYGLHADQTRTGPHLSTKTTQALLDDRLHFQPTYPCNIVQNTLVYQDYGQYLASLKAGITQRELDCQKSLPASTGVCSPCDLQKSTFTETKRMDYKTYYATLFLNKNGIPLLFEKQHYPPPQGPSPPICNKTYTYAEFLTDQLHARTNCN
jgi:hypothetical protein